PGGAGPVAGAMRACSGGRCDVTRSSASGAGIVSATSIKLGTNCDSAPDNHFAAGPHCRLSVSWRRRVSDAGGYALGVGTGSISATGAHKEAVTLSGPDNHFAAGPHRRVVVAVSRNIKDA